MCNYLILEVIYFECYRMYERDHDWSLCQYADYILDDIMKFAEYHPIQ